PPDVFVRVVFTATPNTLPDYLVEIDEQTAAQHPVDLLLPTRIAAHQALERAGLVRRVMVDVESRMSAPPLHDEIDKVFEHAPLVFPSQRPIGVIGVG